jgi:hypothetical protein
MAPFGVSPYRRHRPLFRADSSGVSIVCRGNKFNLDLSDHGNPTPGTPVSIWGQWGGKNQLWRLEPGQCAARFSLSLAFVTDGGCRSVRIGTADGQYDKEEKRMCMYNMTMPISMYSGKLVIMTRKLSMLLMVVCAVR